MIVKEDASFNRSDLISILQASDIECRPIVTGNFLKNKEVLEYFDYEIAGSLEHSEYLDKNGLFVGNHQNDLTEQISYLDSVLKQITSSNPILLNTEQRSI